MSAYNLATKQKPLEETGFSKRLVVDKRRLNAKKSNGLNVGNYRQRSTVNYIYFPIQKVVKIG
jgi:hypothetical protein